MDGLPWWSSFILLPAAVAIFVVPVVQVWAFVDGATVPISRWREIRRNKVLWLVLTCITCGVLAVYYLLV